MTPKEKNIFSIPLIVQNNDILKILGDTKFPNFKIEDNSIFIESDVDEINDIIKNIHKKGIEIRTVKNTFPVLNMSCAACAVSVESILKYEAGVLESVVNYANSTVTVLYIDSIASPEKMKNALLSVGYDIITDEKEKTIENIEKQKQFFYKKLRNKTILALLFSFPVFILGMFFHHWIYSKYIMFVFSTPVVFYFGIDFFKSAIKKAMKKSVNMDTLVALSTGLAYIFSVFNLLFADFWIQKGIESHVYFEAASVIISFILLGKTLEEKAKSNTSDALKKLIELKPKNVIRITYDNDYETIDVDFVKKEDVLLAKPGEKIAVDGIVVYGNSFVDESSMSGEPIPVEKTINSIVLAGTVNQKGVLHYKAQKVGNETLLSQIIKTVQDAQGSKAPVQKITDKISSVFVPVVILISIVSFVVWYLFAKENNFEYALLTMVSVLVIACPCALGLATPTAIVVGIGKAAQNGILIKDAESLETASKINKLLLDKTGTITEGKPKVAEIFGFFEQKDLLINILFSIEKLSEHPLAEAIVEYFNNSELLSIEKFENFIGKGIKAKIDGEFYFVGNKSLIVENKIIISDQFLEKAEFFSNEAKTVIWFANQNNVLGLITITDNIKKSTFEAIQKLKKLNIDVIMLTGDNEKTAKNIAEKCGISNFQANMLPTDKTNYVIELQKQGNIVAMAGDGINDASALAKANVSIAMGKGSDIAIDAAKITIISSDLLKIPATVNLSKHTVKIIKQNLFWAFFYNLLSIPVAAGVLFPIFGFLLNPMFAGIAMSFSSVSVVLNSLRLKIKKI